MIRLPWFALALFSLMLVSRAEAQARPAGPVACAVEWTDGQPQPQALCDALARELGRAVRRVEDARTIKSGDSVQFLNEDLHWVVVWLRAGKVRAWTRVSKALTEDKQLAVMSRVAGRLSRERVSQGATCVRVEPNGGRKMRSADLVYPWAELRQCERRVAEVADPWAKDT